MQLGRIRLKLRKTGPSRHPKYRTIAAGPSMTRQAALHIRNEHSREGSSQSLTAANAAQQIQVDVLRLDR
jgi:hypothetical protein